MEEFLTNYGLYKEYILLENYHIGNQDFIDPFDFVGRPLNIGVKMNKQTEHLNWI